MNPATLLPVLSYRQAGRCIWHALPEAYVLSTHLHFKHAPQQGPFVCLQVCRAGAVQ